jgi:zinc protease
MTRRLRTIVGAVLAALGATVAGAATTSPGAAVAAPAPVAQATDTGTIGYTVDGIRVIQRFAPTSEIVVANLYLLGGVREVTASNTGIELLLLEASEQGTRTYPRERLRAEMARLGTSIVPSAGVDWTSMSLRATRTTLDSTWNIFASRITEPLLDSSGVELVRSQLVAAVRQRQDSPDALVDFLADSFAFAGHPYALSPTGTEASLSGITLADLRTYRAAHFVKSRLLLVVVGNTTRATVERLVRQGLGRLPAGEYVWTLPDTLPRRPSGVLTVDRSLPTNYILGLFPGPPAGTHDYQVLHVATAILSGQFFSEVRSRRNLTYAVDAPFIEHAISAGGMYVTTVQPDVTLDVMRQQLFQLKTGSVDRDALGRLVRQFVTQYFLENEAAEEQADFLARAQLYDGDFHAAESFEQTLRSVTPEDIRRVAQQYIRDVQFVYIGDARRAPTRLMERF